MANLALLRVRDGSVPAKRLFAFGAINPQHAARTRQESHPEQIVVCLSTTWTSSTRCEAAKPANVDKVWQHQSAILPKFTGQDSQPKHWVRPTRNTGRHSCGCHCTLTAKPARFGSAGTCLYAFLKSLGKCDIEWPNYPSRWDDGCIAVLLLHFGLLQARHRSTAQLVPVRHRVVPMHHQSAKKSDS